MHKLLVVGMGLGCACASMLNATPEGRWHVAGLEVNLANFASPISNGYAWIERIDLAGGGSLSGQSLYTSDGDAYSFSGSWQVVNGRVVITDDEGTGSGVLNPTHDFLFHTERGSEAWGSFISLSAGVREPASVSMAQVAGNWTLFGLGLGLSNTDSIVNDSGWTVGAVTLNGNGSGSFQTLDSDTGTLDSFNLSWSLVDKKLQVVSGPRLYLGNAVDVALGVYTEATDEPGATWNEMQIVLREPGALAASEVLGVWDYAFIGVYEEEGMDHVEQETGRITLNANGTANVQLLSASWSPSLEDLNRTVAWSMSGNRIVIDPGNDDLVVHFNASKNVGVGLGHGGGIGSTDFFVATRSTATPLSRGQQLFPGLVDYNDNWGLSSWFGWMNFDGAPYVYHTEHGWIYTPGVLGNGLWFYSNDIGWAFTSPSLYPILYVPSQGSYMSFLKGTSVAAGGRWFYDYGINDWVLFPQP